MRSQHLPSAPRHRDVQVAAEPRLAARRWWLARGARTVWFLHRASTATAASPAPFADCGLRAGPEKGRIQQAPTRLVRRRAAYPSCKRVSCRRKTYRSPHLIGGINRQVNALFPWEPARLSGQHFTDELTANPFIRRQGDRALLTQSPISSCSGSDRPKDLRQFPCGPHILQGFVRCGP